MACQPGASSSSHPSGVLRSGSGSQMLLLDRQSKPPSHSTVTFFQKVTADLNSSRLHPCSPWHPRGHVTSFHHEVWSPSTRRFRGNLGLATSVSLCRRPRWFGRRLSARSGGKGGRGGAQAKIGAHCSATPPLPKGPQVHRGSGGMQSLPFIMCHLNKNSSLPSDCLNRESWSLRANLILCQEPFVTIFKGKKEGIDPYVLLTLTFS